MNNKPIIENKQSFFFGLVTGVALVSLIGFVFIAGGGQRADFGSVDTATNKQVAKAPVAGERAKVDVSAKDHFRGNKNAKVTIVEFSDIQCPYCSRFHQTMKEVMKAYPNEVKWVFKHFPLTSIHPFAKKAAEATECAAEQNKFWELTDKFYENQEQLSDGYITSAAQSLGLDMKKFSDCLSSGKYAAKVEADAALGRKLGVQGTPGSFINGISVPGALPFSDLDQTIRSELAK